MISKTMFTWRALRPERSASRRIAFLLVTALTVVLAGCGRVGWETTAAPDVGAGYTLTGTFTRVSVQAAGSDSISPTAVGPTNPVQEFFARRGGVDEVLADMSQGVSRASSATPQVPPTIVRYLKQVSGEVAIEEYVVAIDEDGTVIDRARVGEGGSFALSISETDSAIALLRGRAATEEEQEQGGVDVACIEPLELADATVTEAGYLETRGTRPLVLRISVDDVANAAGAAIGVNANATAAQRHVDLGSFATNDRSAKMASVNPDLSPYVLESSSDTPFVDEDGAFRRALLACGSSVQNDILLDFDLAFDMPDQIGGDDVVYDYRDHQDGASKVRTNEVRGAASPMIGTAGSNASQEPWLADLFAIEEETGFAAPVGFDMGVAASGYADPSRGSGTIDRETLDRGDLVQPSAGVSPAVGYFPYTADFPIFQPTLNTWPEEPSESTFNPYPVYADACISNPPACQWNRGVEPLIDLESMLPPFEGFTAFSHVSPLDAQQAPMLIRAEATVEKQMAYLRGVVLDASGAPIPDLLVLAMEPDLSTAGFGLTNEHGVYTIKVVTGHTYQVLAALDPVASPEVTEPGTYVLAPIQWEDVLP